MLEIAGANSFAKFLFLIVPSMGFSFFAIREGTLSFRLTAVATILHDLGLVSLIVFFLSRNREPIEQIAWNFANVWRDALLGAVLFVPIGLCARMGKRTTFVYRITVAESFVVSLGSLSRQLAVKRRRQSGT